MCVYFHGMTYFLRSTLIKAADYLSFSYFFSFRGFNYLYKYRTHLFATSFSTITLISEYYCSLMKAMRLKYQCHAIKGLATLHNWISWTNANISTLCFSCLLNLIRRHGFILTHYGKLGTRTVCCNTSHFRRLLDAGSGLKLPAITFPFCQILRF